MGEKYVQDFAPIFSWVGPGAAGAAAGAAGRILRSQPNLGTKYVARTLSAIMPQDHFRAPPDPKKGNGMTKIRKSVKNLLGLPK